ncbi:hypothetical protein GGU10DRAFT_108083 [Lentinula aff. detonsa]|uniref:Uncharacterized protein n=1 Tax=Lentinula aff. detonsa TaxID=2804958 RepID=A0AA38L6W8_9AGAR|nr:hypothetical protein GGU10DRAFT_108083 [Lentinula aff. detonsa]
MCPLSFQPGSILGSAFQHIYHCETNTPRPHLLLSLYFYPLSYLYFLFPSTSILLLEFLSFLRSACVLCPFHILSFALSTDSIISDSNHCIKYPSAYSFLLSYITIPAVFYSSFIINTVVLLDIWRRFLCVYNKFPVCVSCGLFIFFPFYLCGACSIFFSLRLFFLCASWSLYYDYERFLM